MQRPNDHHEAFEQAIALYDWLSHWYGGMSCPKYVAMSKIVGDYKLVNRSCIDYDCELPYDHEDKDQENEGIVMLYHELTEENWEECFENFCDYMDNDWDNDDY